MQKREVSALVAMIQGIYYLITGLWPIFSRRTFEIITGPKLDFWLVRTTGAMIAVVGAVLVWAGLRREITPPMALLGTGIAASLGGSDVLYSMRGKISKIYLFESLAEVGMIGIWLAALRVDSTKR